MSERTMSLGELMVAGVALVTTYSTQVTIAEAEVWPSTTNGVPQMVIPQFLETGVPAFTTPPGGQNPAAGVPTPTSGGGTNDGSGFAGTGSPGSGFVANSFSQYLGQAVGSGQCVALVQAANPSVGLTATWRPGESVQGNTSLQPGTIIATFGPNGNYTNSLDGSAHAAIYLGQNSQGIQVQDQWAGQVDHVRTISWREDSSVPAVNNGSKFYVVSHGV